MANVRHTPEKRENGRWQAMGLMSGTSLDGVDICQATFTRKGGKWSFEILNAKTYPYPRDWMDKLKFQEDLPAKELLKLDHELGLYFANLIQQFTDEYNLSNTEVDLIASHGHTLYHKPAEGISLQIGNGPEIFALTDITTITDFRKQDVVLGGQGAPLVPIGDLHLFSEFDACLNLGGFANVSFDQNGERIAFDLCPVNFVLNHLARELGQAYDEDGQLAKAAQTDPQLLTELNALNFYQLPYPKSLGAEWVWEHFFPILKQSHTTVEKKLRTVVEHVAVQIANMLNRHGLKTCLVTGGGAFNGFLIQCIQDKTDCKLELPTKKIIEFKEALIFGFMGVLKYLGEPNVLLSATGSRKDHSTGIVYSHKHS